MAHLPRRSPKLPWQRPVSIIRDKAPSDQRYHSVRWRKEREQHLQQEPLCRECLSHGHTVPATVVDHIIPVRSGMVDFWDHSNWQSLCHVHHNEKRNRERGTINYGNPGEFKP